MVSAGEAVVARKPAGVKKFFAEDLGGVLGGEAL